MVRTVLLFVGLALFTSCRVHEGIATLDSRTPALSNGYAITVTGDTVRLLPPAQEPAPRRGFLGIGTGKNKVKNSGNVTINITRTDKSKATTDNSVVDKSKTTSKEKMDVVSKPTVKTKSEVVSKTKSDDDTKTVTKTTQGGQLALIGIGAAVVLILFLLVRRKSQ